MGQWNVRWAWQQSYIGAVVIIQRVVIVSLNLDDCDGGLWSDR